MRGTPRTTGAIAHLRGLAGKAPLAAIVLRLGRRENAVANKEELLGLSLRTRAREAASAEACYAQRFDLDWGLIGAESDDD
jgi:hypothetical protein